MAAPPVEAPVAAPVETPVEAPVEAPVAAPEIPVAAPEIPSNSEYTIIPGLYGFGTDTRAAYGGNVAPVILHVDTLAAGVSTTDSTHGSFEWAVTRNFPRIVVFDVSGVIKGKAGDIRINSPYLSIMGQTAPGNVVLNGQLAIRAHNVLVQHLAIRGNGVPGLDTVVVNSNAMEVYNVVIDHCSATWGLDEQFSIAETTHPLHDVTVSNCIIGESIINHAYGSLNYGSDIFHHGNLYIHNYMRNPQLGYTANLVVTNTLAYNYDHSVVNIGSYAGSRQDLTYIGNEAIAGPSSGTAANQRALAYCKGVPAKSYTTIYMEDNINRGEPVDYAVYAAGNGYTVGNKTLPTNHTPLPASESKDYVLQNVGPRPAYRDEVDTRLIDDVVNGTGVIKSSVPALPPIASLSEAFVPVANPHDMYNEHYTNLEHQLHQLAAAVEISK